MFFFSFSLREDSCSLFFCGRSRLDRICKQSRISTELIDIFVFLTPVSYYIVIQRPREKKMNANMKFFCKLLPLYTKFVLDWNGLSTRSKSQLFICFVYENPLENKYKQFISVIIQKYFSRCPHVTSLLVIINE